MSERGGAHGIAAHRLLPLLLGVACAGGPSLAPEPLAPVATNTPELLAPPVGAFTGRVTDALGTAVPSARVQRIDGDRVVAEVRCGGDGTFVLGGVPPGRCSLRALADGFAPGQRGDLDATDDAGRAIDVGALVLLPATPYRGVVRSGGRALAGARVRVHPELQTAGATVPLVRETTSDADGWFFVPDAPPPPVLVQALAEGHVRTAAQRFERADADLELELVAAATVTGQVVDAVDGAPLPNAYVHLIEPAPEPLATRAALPDFARLPGDRVDTDGRFVRPRTQSSWALAVVADGHVGTVFGPFDDRTRERPHRLALPRGAELQWQVDGVAPETQVLVTLCADAASRQDPLAHYFGPAAGITLPPVPPGRWLLTVDSETNAPTERWLDLATPGRHHLAISLPAGTTLRAQVVGSDGQPLAVLATRDEPGLPRTAEVTADGSVALQGLGPGRWRLVVLDRGTDWYAQCRRWLAVDLGGTSIDLAGDGTPPTIELQAPARAFGSLQLRTNEPAIDRIALEAPPGAPPAFGKVRDALRRTDLRDTDGTFRLDPVLPGRWLLRAYAGPRLVHERTIEVEAGAPTVVALP
ncbi:MAG: carboxypeptidase regulatory-like domain-containing protein [Planctomycetes bacterium]|nr:carboxypeptidase regulatory-like domain-containing protein [Planctomycetota bacterium]